MFDWIPLEYYTPIFYNIEFVIILILVMKLFSKGYVIQKPNKKEYAPFFLLIGVVLYMGLRPISGAYFTDMWSYNKDFQHYASGGLIKNKIDLGWNMFMKFCSTIMTAKMFFLVCAILYVAPLYKAAKNWLGWDKYLLFFMFMASFSFWAYGTNGIRNGIATSLFVLGISYTNKRIFQYAIITLSFFVHASTIIPISAFILSIFYKNPKHYLMGWFFCIPLSLAFGGLFENLFASLGFQNDRLYYLTEGNINNNNFAYTGFRWDFLIYSASAVFAGYYFIIRKKFKDKIYIQLFNIYVMANAFWILVIRANFSNRFAYLSWFLMAVVIFYPFLKAKFFKNQNKVLAYVILGFFSFTYFMFLIS
tara:strand:+ start:7150 stop:8238 length:1089 start_codon:yes stop_codon:yes gene_type:complete